MSKVICHGCGVEKDTSVKEVYPWREEDAIVDHPIDPIFDVDVQPEAPKEIWKRALVCHSCFHKLNMDMWTAEWVWIDISPHTSFDDLPTLDSRPKESP